MGRPMTITEKIFANSAGLPEVVPGQMVTAKIGMVYLMEMRTKRTYDYLKSLGATEVFDREKVAIFLDHCVPPTDSNWANLHVIARKFAEEYHVPIYDVGNHGLMHHMAVEEGYVVPGIIAIGTDSHAPTGGAVGAVVTGAGATDSTIAVAEGELWMRVPASVKIKLSGNLPKGVMSRDITIYFMGQKGWDGTKAEWAYKAIEFTGETVKRMSMDSRLALCNLASDTGAKNAIIAPDEVTEAYLKGRARRPYQVFQSDVDAQYAEEIAFDVSHMEPQVACPHSPDNVKPLSQVLGTKINVATIATCSSGRMEDFHIAAKILEGKKIHPSVRMVVSPSSQKIYAQAMEDGTFRTFQKAGIMIGHSTCGPCTGAQLVCLGDGEVCIGSVPRNMKGRMGSKTSEIYSANPAVVAASAIAGCIADPKEFLK